jgi:hypothetical protein
MINQEFIWRNHYAMKIVRNSIFALVALAALATAAKADPTTYYLDLTLSNGATFKGTVDFNSSLTEVTSLTGTLSDYVDGKLGFNGSGTDSLSLVGDGIKIGPTLDGVSAGDASWQVNIGTKKHPHYITEENLLTLYFNLSNPEDITLIDIPFLSGVDYQYSGDIVASESTMTPTPEPGSILLLGSGLAGLALVLRKKMALNN